MKVVQQTIDAYSSEFREDAWGAIGVELN